MKSLNFEKLVDYSLLYFILLCTVLCTLCNFKDSETNTLHF